MLVGVSGKKGSFSEEAAEYYLKRIGKKNYRLLYLTSVENVLSALEREKIDLGIFPIENSNGGIVYEAVQAMSRHNFNIKKFFEIDIQHCLLVLPQTLPQQITGIASHPQALKQCRMYLKRKWPKMELIEWKDTALAAKNLAEGKMPSSTAVIAPERSAELYNLDILESGIQDLKFNFTTFLAVEKRIN